MSMADVWQTTPILPAVPLAESLRFAARAGAAAASAAADRDAASLARAPGGCSPRTISTTACSSPASMPSGSGSSSASAWRRQLHLLTCDHDWGIVAHDKLVCTPCCRSLGFPMPNNRALYRDGAAFAGGRGLQSLPDRAALAEALRGGLEYPLFGKPVRGMRSVGVLSIDGYDSATDHLRLAQGEAVAGGRSARRHARPTPGTATCCRNAWPSTRRSRRSAVRRSPRSAWSCC